MLANSWDKACVMRVTEPMIAGNRVLAPGTYVWKLLDSNSNHNLVEITDQSTGQVEATMLAIPAYRQVASPKVELQFWETPRGVPRAVRKMFYPGDNYGQEYVYPAKMVAHLQLQLPSQEHLPVPIKAAALIPVPAKRVVVRHRLLARSSAQVARPSVLPEGSWATVGPVAAPPKKPSDQGLSAQHHSGFWDGLKSLPLTATIGPLIGLIGAGSLMLSCSAL